MQTIFMNGHEFRQFITEENIKTNLYVSQKGEVIFRRGNSVTLRKSFIDRNGYVMARESKNVIFTVHRMVMTCWSDDIVDNTVVVKHIDGNKKNNHIDNLYTEDKMGDIQYYQEIFKPYFHWKV